MTNTTNANQTILTGIKPTGEAHIGNYFGAIKPSIELSNDNEAKTFYFLADYHSMTTIKNGKQLKDYVYDVAATWLALGLDPKNSFFYRQSDIPEIFELSWILACYTPKGDMNRAHAYKALVSENLNSNTKDADKNINMGIYTYPILMAADILLFDADIVPVGKDQVQHVEIARSIAQRINQLHKKEVFRIPQEQIKDELAVIQGLDGKKMSKSYSNTIPIFMNEKKLKKTINRITTDSTEADAPKDPDSSIIFDYYKYFSTKQEVQEFREKLIGGLSWGYAKAELFEKIRDTFSESKKQYDYLMANTDIIDKILEEGAQKTRKYAADKMAQIRSLLIS